MNSRISMQSMVLAGLVGLSGVAVPAWAQQPYQHQQQTPHQTYHQFHNRQPVRPASGTVLYVQPSYPFTRYYVQPGQDPASIPHHQSAPSYKGHGYRHPHHGHGYRPHYYGHDNYPGHGYRDHDDDYEYGRRSHHRIVQDGNRLSLYDEHDRAVRQVYLRPGSSWERHYGHVIIRSKSRLEVYDRNLHRIAGMYMAPDATHSFRKNRIVVRTRFYTEVYDYNLRQLDRYRS